MQSKANLPWSLRKHNGSTACYSDIVNAKGHPICCVHDDHAAMIVAAVNATVCGECKGAGQVCVGTSGRDDDGNAPILEHCEACDGSGREEEPEPDSFRTLGLSQSDFYAGD